MKRLSFLISIVFFLSSYVFAASPKCNIEKFENYQMEYCLYEGSGPLLVFEAPQGYGMSAWPKLFLNQLNQFSKILIYNRIGYGQSYFFNKKVWHDVTAKNVSKHLYSLLQRLNLSKQVIIVAHSIGGIYAQYFIRNYPQNVAGAVMIDADSSFEPKINSPFQSKIPEKKGTIGYFESKGFNQSMDEVNFSPPFPNVPLLVITATNHGSDQATEKLWQALQQKLVKQSTQGQQIIAYDKGHFIYKDDPEFVVQSMSKFMRVNKLAN